MLEWSSTYLSNLAGVIAFVLSLVMRATSLDRVRRKMFELLYYAHQLYLPFIFFNMCHVGVAYLHDSSWDLPLIDRHLRFLQSKWLARLDSARLLPNGTMELTFSKDPGLSYTPTSILFVHVPSICKLQWNPFTETSNSNLETNKLSIMIKIEGSWTQKLCEQLSSSLDHLQVSTEDPYGPASTHFPSHESLVMISGGSGIAPLMSIIREIIFRRTESNGKVPKVLLIAAFRNRTDLTMLISCFSCLELLETFQRCSWRQKRMLLNNTKGLSRMPRIKLRRNCLNQVHQIHPYLQGWGREICSLLEEKYANKRKEL